jgi:ribosomal protein S12 methylthiotransferase accessory factor YcaO
MTQILFERYFTSSQALNKFDNELSVLGLKSQDIKIFVTESIYFYKCFIFQKEKEDIFTGFGKGLPLESLIGAKFEALQQFLSFYSNKFIASDKENFLHASFEDMLSQKKPLLLSRVPSDIKKNKQLQQLPLIWSKFRSLCGKKNFYVPQISTQPITYTKKAKNFEDFPYDEIYLEHSDNGIAIGCNYNEALLHSLLEVIERDAWAFFLLNYFVHKKSKTIKIVNNDSLPEEIKEKIKDIEQKISAKIYIIEMPNDFSIFSYAAIINLPDYPVAIKGFGASISQSHAILRSFHEVIQSLGIHLESPSHETFETYCLLKDILWIKECMEFNIENLMHDNQLTKEIISVNFNKKVEDSTEAHLQTLISLIKKNGFEIYVKCLYESKNVTLLQTIIPTTENFFVASEGILINPHYRNDKVTEGFYEKDY